MSAWMVWAIFGAGWVPTTRLLMNSFIRSQHSHGRCQCDWCDLSRSFVSVLAALIAIVWPIILPIMMVIVRPTRFEKNLEREKKAVKELEALRAQAKEFNLPLLKELT